ncbi:helix-turn-helix domain-containing protein, partial [Candidatus Uhrbacteria bacterium]|nr:helix-turn-helix domain-containing protein [Candidatus Uhrbacteria bacterium]
MVSLTSKRIADDGGLATILKEARVAGRLSLEKLEKISLVQKKYLVALEEGKYWDLPSKVYARQFFLAYCKSLGLKGDVLSEKFENEYRTYMNWQERSQRVKPVATAPAPALIISPSMLQKSAAALLMVGFLSYIGLQINHIIQSPRLVIDSPSDNLITSKQVVEIKGHVESESHLTVNGQDVYTDKDGNFNEVMGLQPGIN